MRNALMSKQTTSAQQDTAHRPALKQPAGADIIMLKKGQTRVSCQGDNGALGHPQIWLTAEIQPDGTASVTCPYCSRIFQRPIAG